MAARLCPHCDTRSNFNDTMMNAHTHWGKEAERFEVAVDVLSCQNCDGVVISFRKFFTERGWKEWLSYPVSLPKVDKAVPDKVAADYVSAVNCLSIGEHKAAVTMFRRSLQQIMIDKNAKGSRLYDQIDDLATNGIITEDLKNWAHEIRLWGNEGAHPSKDGLDEVTEKETTEVKKFLESLFQYIYIMPATVTSSRSARNKKKQP